jgi:hypothetical protein
MFLGSAEIGLFGGTASLIFHADLSAKLKEAIESITEAPSL